MKYKRGHGTKIVDQARYVSTSVKFDIARSSSLKIFGITLGVMGKTRCREIKDVDFRS
jgi:hypothetical protein